MARTAYTYDAGSRLTGLSNDLVTGGSTSDAAWVLNYNPASQLIGRTASSSLYEWSYGTTFTDAYTVNALNQYVTAGGAGLTYDGRGNTTNDTTKYYEYDSSNLLTASLVSVTPRVVDAALTYDPTGRLLTITKAGATTKFVYEGTRLIAEYSRLRCVGDLTVLAHGPAVACLGGSMLPRPRMRAARTPPACGGRARCTRADGGVQKFPFAASCRISLSSVRSDTALRRRWFSTSRSFIHRPLVTPPSAKLPPPSVIGHVAHADDRTASDTEWPCANSTSTCRSLATTSSGLCLFLGISVLRPVH